MKPEIMDDKRKESRSPEPTAPQLGRKRGVDPVRFLSVSPGSTQETDSEVVVEALVCISVNGRELATFMCTPVDLDRLALGFLFNEGLIAGLEEVADIHISANESCVDVWLHDPDPALPERKIYTAGCGGGVTFDDLSERHEPLASTLEATPGELAELMRATHLGAEMYQRARGIHTAVLADRRQVLLQVEDVGRHNCLDKLSGAALLAGVPTRDRMILTSGRISSEMINKARRLETPIICSRTSPTSLSVELAKSWKMTIVAYLRQSRMRIYTHPERIRGNITKDRGPNGSQTRPGIPPGEAGQGEST